MIQTLCSANVPDSTIMQLSGHKSITSLNHYKKPSLDQQRSMSNLLSTLQADPSLSCSPSPASKQETNLHSNQLCCIPGLLSNDTFNGCTVHIHVNTPSLQLFTAANQPPTNASKHPKSLTCKLELSPSSVIVPRPSRMRRRAWYPLFAHVSIRP